MGSLDEIKTALINLDIPQVQCNIRQSLAEGLSPAAILEEGLIAGMNIIGTRFKEGDIFMPEVLVAAKAMHIGLDILKPLLIGAENQGKGTVVIGTVKGDLHDIGKNLVGMMCEGAGFEVRDLGKDLGPEAFVEAVKKYEPDIIGLSALLTTTMRGMEQVIKALQEAGLRDKVKVIVGGAPVTQAFATQIGADGYASNAAAAADLARKLVSAKSR